jgi:Ni,Fe-hydrogenase I large subunit
MLFDVVAVAMFYAEYFWLGNAHERFLAYGVFEKGDLANPNGDKRLLSRGRKTSGNKYGVGGTQAAPFVADQKNVYESVHNSHYLYDGGRGGWKHPLAGETFPETRRVPGHSTHPAYSWVKSPRYKDATDTGFSTAVPYEAGPLARMQVNGDYYGGILYDLGYTSVLVGPLAGAKVPQYGDPGPDLSGVYAGAPNLGGISYNGDSALDRYAARQLECHKVAHALPGWLDRLEGMIGNPTSETRTPGTDKYFAESYGWTEAPRGALGHWMKTDMNTGKIEKYQCVVPSTWNASPTDQLGTRGPAEEAMMGAYVRDPNNPLEIARISHSWDFCTACAVHLVTQKGRGKKEETNFTIEPAPTSG